MRRVAFITDALGPGGAERQLVLLAEALATRGWTPRVLRYHDELFHRVPPGCEDRRLPRRGPTDPTMVAALARELRRGRVDVVHSWKPQAAAYAGLAGLGPGRVPHVMHLHTGRAHLLASPVRARSYLIAAALADHVVGVAEDGLAWLAEQGLPAARMSWIPNLVGQELIEAPPTPPARAAARLVELGLPAGSAAPIVVIGRVDANKNPSGIARAMGLLRAEGVQVPPLLAVGAVAEPEELARLQRAAAAAGLVFAHHGPVEAIHELIDAAAVVALGSHAEGLPMVAIEAMARGATVVVPDTGAVRRVVDDGRTGFVATQRDGRTTDAALALALRRALAADPAIGAAGRSHALAALSPDAVTGQWTRLYERLLGERAGPMLPLRSLPRLLAGLLRP